MATKAEIILDSISPAGVRLTTIAVEFPRFLLAEVNTHRVFSRSYASSRAIPVAETLRRVREEPFIPAYWGKNQKGMQASEETDKLVKLYFPGSNDTRFVKPKQAWKGATFHAIQSAMTFSEAGYHKQLVNRLLEPFSYVTGIITATEWDNFFTLRLHPDAQPEFQELAQAMKVAMDGSEPKLLREGQWHLPYILPEEKEAFNKFAWITNKARNWSPIDTEKAVSAARCARASFASNQRGQAFTIEQDLALYERLFGPPKHAGPFEHQGSPMEYASANAIEKPAWEKGITHMDREGNYWSANFKGWIQQRQLL